MTLAGVHHFLRARGAASLFVMVTHPETLYAAGGGVHVAYQLFGDGPQNVPYNGGGLNSVTIADQNYYHDKLPAGLPTPTGVDESMQRWARHNGCAARYTERRISPEVRKRSWPHCKAATVLYIVDNGGHAWPGKPQPAFEQTFGHGTTDIDATSLMFAFLFDHKT